MYFRVRIITKKPLPIRTGPASSFTRVAYAYYGREYVIDNKAYTGKETWYHIINTDRWFVGAVLDGEKHTMIIAGDKTKITDPPTRILDNEIIKSVISVNGTIPKDKIDEITKANSSTYNEKINPTIYNSGNIPYTLQDSLKYNPDEIIINNNALNDTTTRTYNSNINTDNKYSDSDIKYNNNFEPSYEVKDLTYGSVNGNLNSVNISTSNILDDVAFNDAMENVKINNNANFFKSSEHLTSVLANYTNMYGIEFPDAGISKTFTKVFFTRPDLNLFQSNTKSTKLLDYIDLDPTYAYAFYRNPLSLQLLTADYSQEHDFNLLLSEKCKSFDIADETIETQTVGENVLGFKMLYGKSMHSSLTAGTFNITISDNRDAIIYLMLNGWVKYISDVFHGIYPPSDYHRKRKEIDYMCDCYYFVLAEDGETIIYFTKYYGVFPINIPSSSFSKSVGSMINTLDYNVQFGYCFKDPLSAMTLAEFNINSIYKNANANINLDVRNLWNNEVGHGGSTFAGLPFIKKDKSPLGYTLYKLKYQNKSLK